MKKIFLFLCALCFLKLTAQSVDSLPPDAPLRPVENWHAHELQLGFGDPLYAFMYMEPDFFYFPQRYTDSWFEELPAQWNLITATHSLSYKYRIKKWFWVGGAISYTAVASRPLSEQHWSQSHFIAIAPEVRFSYLNKPWVTLYSGINLGFAITCGNALPETQVNFISHINLFGVKAGKNLYGFFEFGVGAKGFLSTGIGYHFKNCK